MKTLHGLSQIALGAIIVLAAVVLCKDLVKTVHAQDSQPGAQREIRFFVNGNEVVPSDDGKINIWVNNLNFNSPVVVTPIVDKGNVTLSFSMNTQPQITSSTTSPSVHLALPPQR
jgi:hypothetical protein